MPRNRWVLNWRGEEVALTDLARRHGLRPQTLRSRIERGMDLPRALDLPPLPLPRRQESGRKSLQRRLRDPRQWGWPD